MEDLGIMFWEEWAFDWQLASREVNRRPPFKLGQLYLDPFTGMTPLFDKQL